MFVAWDRLIINTNVMYVKRNRKWRGARSMTHSASSITIYSGILWYKLSRIIFLYYLNPGPSYVIPQDVLATSRLRKHPELMSPRQVSQYRLLYADAASCSAATAKHFSCSRSGRSIYINTWAWGAPRTACALCPFYLLRLHPPG
jgi:hypothetical protein